MDRYSAYELEIKLKEAKEELDGAKNATESVKKTRDSKQEELNRANDDYEEKKKIWENLAKVAKDKAEIWEKDENSARKANNEYAKAKESYEKANKQLTEEKEKLKKFPDSIRPERLIELRQNKTDKINGKPQLQPTIDRLSLVEQAKYREWETARDEYENDIAGYVRDKCNDKSQALPSCPATEASIEETRPMANQAETDYKLAKIAYDTAINELRDYDKDLRKLEKDIKDLEDAIAEVEYWEGVKKKAEEDQELKRVANETAQEKVKNGRPPEIETATQASIIMKIAERTKKRINNDLKILDAKLNEAKAMETKLESDVGKLEKAYAEARKKEDPQTGYEISFFDEITVNLFRSSALLGVGLAIGGLVLVIGAVIGGFFLYRHLKKKGNGPDDKKKPKKGGKIACSKIKKSNAFRCEKHSTFYTNFDFKIALIHTLIIVIQGLVHLGSMKE